MTLPEQVHRIITTSEWSRAERRILPLIEDEVLRYLADGEGNQFIAEYCRRVVMPRLAEETTAIAQPTPPCPVCGLICGGDCMRRWDRVVQICDLCGARLDDDDPAGNLLRDGLCVRCHRGRVAAEREDLARS